MEQIKVLLADDKEIFREGLARLLDEQEQIEVVSQCSNGKQAIEKAEETRPDVVLIDNNISDCDSSKVIQQINESFPKIKVAMLTDSKGEDTLFSAIEAGATGYLLKEGKVVDLIKSIDLIAEGKVVVSPPLARRLVAKAKGTKVKNDLSERETEILKLLAKGATNKEIAGTLFITENTAKVHLKNILQKLRLRNRQQAAAYAVQEGLVTEVTDTE